MCEMKWDNKQIKKQRIGNINKSDIKRLSFISIHKFTSRHVSPKHARKSKTLITDKEDTDQYNYHQIQINTATINKIKQEHMQVCRKTIKIVHQIKVFC